MLIPGSDERQDVVARATVEVDARDGGLRPREDDVLGFLHVDGRGAQLVKHVRQHARPR